MNLQQPVRLRRGRLAIAVAALVALSACGGGGGSNVRIDPPPPPDPPPTSNDPQPAVDVHLALTNAYEAQDAGFTGEGVTIGFLDSGIRRGPDIVKAFSSMAAGLQRGQAFSTVLGASGLPLPEYVGQLVRAGELTGELGQALEDAGQQLEYEQRVRNEIRNALVYPAVLVVAGVAAVALMFLFVVPRFATMLDRAQDLPLLAWLVLSTGVWLREYFAIFAVVVVALSAGAVYLSRQARWRVAAVDRLALLPLVGDWLVEADTARWAKVLSVLLGNKVPIMRALELAQSGLQIPARRARMAEVTRAVRSGSPLAAALEDHDALTATGYNLVRVGERSGKLAPMLDALARLYEEAGRNRMKRLLVLIEPLAILVIGSMIGVIMIGIILAITSANDIAI